MRYEDIGRMPQTLTREVVDNSGNTKGWHESVLRSYHIVEKVKWLLEQNTAPAIVLELINLMESREFEPYGDAVEHHKYETAPGITQRFETSQLR